MADLKACPFCGSSDGFVERYDYSSCYWQCEGCLARGPLKVIEDEGEEIPGHDPALLAWNTRAEADGGEAVAWQFRLASDKDGEWQNCKPFVFELMRDQPEDYEVRELYTRSNAKAGEVELAAEYTRGRCDGWDAREAKAGEVGIIESIAQQWDGCMYEGVGEDIDIGQAIRNAALSAPRGDGSEMGVQK